MADQPKTIAIVNPSAGRGRAGRQWPRTEALLRKELGELAVRFTRQPEEATDLVAQALDNGCDLVIAVGGDGTVNEVANGFHRGGKPVRPGAALGFIPVGTGGDLQRTLRVPTDAKEAVRVIAQGCRFEIDIARARLTGHDGARVERLFVNLLSFGMGGDVSIRAKAFPRWCGGKTAFLGATLLVFLGYRGKSVRLTLDETPRPESFVVTNVALGNGRYHGGGMHPCPRAMMNDGLLEVTTIDRLSMFELMRDLRILYSDDVYQHPKVRHFRARTIRAESSDLTRVEVDGEALGTLPLEVEILPDRLPVLIAPDSPLRASNRDGSI